MIEWQFYILLTWLALIRVKVEDTHYGERLYLLMATVFLLAATCDLLFP